MLSCVQFRHRNTVSCQRRGDFVTQSFQPFRCIPAELALPYHDHPPACGLQGCLLASVSLRVGPEFLIPAFDIRSRRCRISTTGVAMPETTMNENCGFVLGQDEVRGPRQIARVQPIAKALRVKVFSYGHFRFRILGPYA